MLAPGKTRESALPGVKTWLWNAPRQERAPAGVPLCFNDLRHPCGALTSRGGRKQTPFVRWLHHRIISGVPPGRKTGTGRTPPVVQLFASPGLTTLPIPSRGDMPNANEDEAEESAGSLAIASPNDPAEPCRIPNAR